MKKIRAIAAGLLFSLCVCANYQGAALDNPMIWGYGNTYAYQNDVIDVGVMKYNGEYYVTGNWMDGNMLVSKDMVNWDNRTKVLSLSDVAWATVTDDEQIHASDINYHNGVFHLFFQVYNSGDGQQRIGHATSSTPLGTYTDPSATPFGVQCIDAELYRAPDGQYYYYNTQFTAGNVNWGSAMSDPWTLSGSWVDMLHARTSTWERADRRTDGSWGTPINEGPWIIDYRDKYYHLYACNNTDHLYGNYAIGCAMADTPLGFSDSNKYPDPVLDSSTQLSGDYVYCTGQPWMVRGLNGFEWWLGYFGIWGDPNGESWRFQGMDRAWFFNNLLYVDGTTDLRTSGFHPEPAAPQYGSVFDGDYTYLSPRDWTILSGTWGVNTSAEEAWQNATSLGGYAVATLNHTPATHYLFEANVKLLSGNNKAGIGAYYQDAANWLIFGIDQSANSWYYLMAEGGAVTGPVSTTLDGHWSGFNFAAYHCLQVQKNAGDFTLYLDGLPAPGSNVIATSFTGKGVPALYTDETEAAFDGVIYTIGWDEFNTLKGWGNAASGQAVTGTWNHGAADGSQQTSTSGAGEIWKGDLMEEYEFIAQATVSGALSGEEKVGFYPVYEDSDNYLRVTVGAGGMAEMSGRQNGSDLSATTAKIPTRVVLSHSPSGENWSFTTSNPGGNWADSSFDHSGWSTAAGPFSSWTGDDIWIYKEFTLDQEVTPWTQLYLQHDNECEVYINGVLAADLPEHPSQCTYNGFYRYYDIAAEARVTMTPGSNSIAIHCNNSGGGEFIDAGIHNPKIFDSSMMDANLSWNLRSVKRHNKTHIIINGVEMFVDTHDWNASQPGLYTWNKAATFNGITCFQRNPSEPGDWNIADIGYVLGDGMARFEGGDYPSRQELRLESYGDNWFTSDTLTYVYQPVTGDVDMVARINRHDSRGYWGRAGIMLRDSLNMQSKVAVSARLWRDLDDHWISFIRRNTGGAYDTAGNDTTHHPLPTWVRLKRAGSLISAYHSTDGMNWNLLTNDSLVMSGTDYIGLTATSSLAENQTTAVFQDFSAITPLGSAWTGQDVGTVSGAGRSGHPVGKASTFHLESAGRDIWDADDGIHYVHQTVAGDVDIRARITEIEDTGYWAKGGVMVRENLTNGSKHAAMLMTPYVNPNTTMIRRDSQDGASGADDNTDNLQPPYYVRLSREGNTFTTYRSADGQNWTQHASHNFTMNATAYAGLAVTAWNQGSPGNESLCTMEADNVILRVGPPSPWQSADIGVTNLRGITGYDSGTFYVEGSGEGIHSEADDFRFVYQTLEGDGEIVARVHSIQDQNAWSKAGIMVRKSLDAGAQFSMVALRADGEIEKHIRLADDSGTGLETLSGAPYSGPYWLRLVRNGDTITGYASPDGSAWTEVSTSHGNTNYMNATVYVGLVVTSNNASAMSEGVFDNVTVADGDYVAPSAEIQVEGLSQKVAAHTFTVTYNDNMAIDVSSLGNDDLRATGPNGYDEAAQFVSSSPDTDAPSCTATYQLPAPDGSGWKTADNGAYTVTLQTDAVQDRAGLFVPGGGSAIFTVQILDPAASRENWGAYE